MEKTTPISSRDLGLEFASICGKFFLNLEHLHYGYWPANLPVNIHNLKKAQENYTDFLVMHIPSGVRKILDVGCGSGQTAKRLIEMGYEVSCCSPNKTLNEKVRGLLGDSIKIYNCKYEELATDEKFDLVLFSESYQYIKVDKSMAKNMEILNPDGWFLICDVFKKEVDGEKNTGGGHRLSKFYKQAGGYNFVPREDIDITEFTSPNLDLLDSTLKNVIQPVINSTRNFLAGRYPYMTKIISWLYNKKIEKAENKYFNGQRTSENFRKFKTYRLFLYQNCCVKQKKTHLANDLAVCCNA